MSEPITAFGDEDLLPEIDPEGVDPDAILPGQGAESISLTAKDRDDLAREIEDIIDGVDSAMRERIERWKDIQRSYDQWPDPETQGQRADSSRLVSELTRAFTNVAMSRIVEGVMGMRPLMQFEVYDDQAQDEETAKATEEAKAAEEFFESWSELRRDSWLPRAVGRAARLGDCILRPMWEVNSKTYRYLDDQRNVQEKTIDEGRIQTDLIPNECFVCWPLDEPDIERLHVAGHKSYLVPAAFRARAGELNLDMEEIEHIIEASSGTQPEPSLSREILKGKDVEVGHNPYKSEVEIYELWGDLPFPGKTESQKWQLFYWRPEKKILWIGFNPLNCQRHPYHRIPYWPEDQSFWSSGVGHELLYAQAADSALMNMRIDNLKITGNYVRITRAGTIADSLRDEVAPGATITTDDVEKDIRFEALGGDLPQIDNAEEKNEFRAMRNTGITAPSQGFADPVLKSGASPSSLSQLIEQAGKKFGHIDRGMRIALSDLWFFFFELYQQYAPADGLAYVRLSEEKAEHLQRIKFRPPFGDLRSTFRITAKAPSAASNQEIHKQHLMVLYRLSVEHVQMLLENGAALEQDNAEGYRRLVLDSFRYVHDLWILVAEQQEVPGSGPRPQFPQKTEQDEIINQQQQQLQQLQQQLQSMQQQAQQPAMGPETMGMGTPPGMPPGPPGV